ncbi:epsin-2-like [Plakobranchus ocellatus]|uniref:Epsin-2-like n=1 Tax=Plakobranchus ocellatus TaxID=259542 RepID=A0AAV4D1W2_9GAST|nr:epsin-2-like [Plakobranchus ocellatus]
MPAIRRTLKNVVKNYSDAQVKVREATSNDPWGPSSTLMSEIADLTYNVVAFTEIMQMVWKRLNDDGKYWRHVYKSLVVLDYIIKTGSEKVAQQCKENFHAIKTLTSFQHIDADNKDQGMHVREKAKRLVAMLSDDERLKNERAKALKAKERFAQNAMGVGNGHSSGPRSRAQLGSSPTMRDGYQDQGYSDSASPGSGSAGTPSEIEHARPSSAGEEELQLQLAMVLSKEEHEENMRKQKSDDIKLQMAIEQSKEHAKTNVQAGTLLDLAGPSSSSSGANHSAATNDPWGVPSSQPQPSTDPWGSPLPPPQTSTATTASADPWGSSGGASGGAQVTDPWGMPVSRAGSQPGAGAWSSSSPTPQASAWGAPSPTTQQQTPTSTGVDAFGAPLGMSAANGASSSTANPIDSEFDLLSARSTETSPTKSSAHGLEEFDLLAGGSKSNGSSDGAFALGSLDDNLPSGPSGKKKSAEEFLGGHANLVNLDQLVSKAPPPGNNPFAMTTGNNNPFHDPNANVRVPMAQMAASSPSGPTAFAPQPTNSGLLPAPLLPLGSSVQQQQQQPQPAASYNPFL